jgi:23S rRNA pseudouridine1911/1915/1917 synthase
MQEPQSLKVVGAEPEVIFENSDFIVINKPSGLMVHAVRVNSKKRLDEVRSKEPTLVDWLLGRYPEIASVGDEPLLRPGIVHRLDKDTSGVMIIARTQPSFEYLKSLFQKHEIKKTYEALVLGVPKKEHDIIDAPIGIKNGTLKRSINASKMAKEAITEYRVIKKYKLKDSEEEFALLEVKPQTGRTHQIRVHLASIGHPIVGDRLYGKKNQPPFVTRLMLHALAIEFIGMTGARFDFEVKLSTSFFLGNDL